MESPGAPHAHIVLPLQASHPLHGAPGSRLAFLLYRGKIFSHLPAPSSTFQAWVLFCLFAQLHFLP